jgi:hypothetical protein
LTLQYHYISPWYIVERNGAWFWKSNYEDANKDFLEDRWAKKEPNGKTEDGLKIFKVKWGDRAVAVMDSDGKLRDEDYLDFHMSICNYQISGGGGGSGDDDDDDAVC